MRSILSVDDSDSYHFLAEFVIKQLNDKITVYKAYDGQEALDLLSQKVIKPDVILLDINMPGMNGHEFLAAYSQIHDKEIPIVAMLTSSDQIEDKENAAKYSFVKDYLVKPLQAEHLQKLEKIVEQFKK